MKLAWFYYFRSLMNAMPRLLLTTIILGLHFQAFTQIDHWETAVYENDSWSYRLGNSEAPTNWAALDFDDSNWIVGQGSIGYADNDDNTIIDPVASLYMRRTFNIIDLSKIEQALLHADFDDGFVAYLNGVEIARSNVEGFPPTYDQGTPMYREALIYQGGEPIGFSIPNASIQQILSTGENVLAIHTHNHLGLMSSDLTTSYWLSFGINDSSNDYGPTPSWFNIFEFDSPLPIVNINTGGGEIPDEPAIQAEMGIIWNNGGSNSNLDFPNEFFGNITIEKRGQSSLFFPKTGYGFETKDESWEDMDTAFLNFPAEEDWVLHGPYSDKSLLRNILAMDIANKMGQYASRTRLVELIINEQYEGIYVLMEKIKRDNDRVDIAKLRTEDIAGDELTGGYIFKIDKGEADWISRYNMQNNNNEKLRFQYVSPKRSKIQPAQANYIQSYVDSFEQAMVSPLYTFGGKRYDEYIDLAFFADHFIITELSRDVDAYRISSYLFKDKDSNGGLLKCGPVWDFNLAFGNADYCNGFSEEGLVYYDHCGNSNPFWWNEMFNDGAFKNTVKCRWNELRQGPLDLDNLYSFIDEKAALLAPAVDRNFERWPILNQYVWPNAVVPGSYAGEIEYLKEYLERRINWLDINLFGTCLTNTEELSENAGFTLYPNPTRNVLNIELTASNISMVQSIIYDVLGNELHSQYDEASDKLIINLEDANLAAGIYYLKLNARGQWLGVKSFVLQ